MKMGLLNHSFQVSFTLCLKWICLLSDWLWVRWASSAELSKAGAPRCSTWHSQSYVLAVTRSSWIPWSCHVGSWFQELWSWLLMDIERLVNQEGQSTSCFCAFSGSSNLCKSWKQLQSRKSPVHRAGQPAPASPAIPALNVLFLPAWAAVKAGSSSFSGLVRNDGWEIPLWTCNRAIKLWYLPGRADGSPRGYDLGAPMSGWVLPLHTPTLHSCTCHCRLHHMGLYGFTNCWPIGNPMPKSSCQKPEAFDLFTVENLWPHIMFTGQGIKKQIKKHHWSLKTYRSVMTGEW